MTTIGSHLTTWLRWFGSVRLRAAIASALIVGGTFALGAVGVTLLLRSSLYASAANTASAEAIDIASVITTRGQVPRNLPSSAEDIAVQVLRDNGKVVSSSRNVTGQSAMVSLAPKAGQVATSSSVVLRVRRFTHVDLDLDSRFVVAATGVETPTFTGTVLVANSLGAADHAIDLIITALAIALPTLTLFVGGLVWMFTGWALRPVELIRSEVAKLSTTDLHYRVAELGAQDEIGRLARTMNAMLVRLEASNDRQRQLVADVSHELRNPLAALRAELEVEAVHPGKCTADHLKDSLLEVDRMTQLVEDLLTLARIDEGAFGVRPVEVDLDDLALTYADRLRRRGRVEVSVEGVTAAGIRGDREQLGRVVANLAENGERHAQHRVSFSVMRAEDSFDLVVADDGQGVPPEQRQRIFERFVRLDAARTHQGTGAGLGLAIVREIVLAHGGSVWVEDAFPGARFVVRLPVDRN
jgi:signal transduction histidine kinase